MGHGLLNNNNWRIFSYFHYKVRVCFTCYIRDGCRWVSMFTTCMWEWYYGLSLSYILVAFIRHVVTRGGDFVLVWFFSICSHVSTLYKPDHFPFFSCWHPSLPSPIQLHPLLILSIWIIELDLWDQWASRHLDPYAQWIHDFLCLRSEVNDPFL